MHYFLHKLHRKINMQRIFTWNEIYVAIHSKNVQQKILVVVVIMVLVLFHDMAKIGFFFISTAAAPVKNNMFCKSLT